MGRVGVSSLHMVPITVSDWLQGNGEMARQVRAYDWSASALGPIEQWPLVLRLALRTALDNHLPMALAWGPEHCTLYNDAYRLLLGDKTDALGGSFLEVWGEAGDWIGPRMAQALLGESSRLEGARLELWREGRLEEAFFDHTFSSVRDETGAVVGVLNIAVETTGRVLAERQRAEISVALHASETRFHALVTTGADSIYRMSPDWRLMYALDSQTLATTSGPIEDWPNKYILEEDRARVFAAIGTAIRNRSLFELEHRVRHADGSIGWVLSRAVPLPGLDGRITEWFGSGRDVTERRMNLEKLHESEDRLRTVLDGIDEQFYVLDRDWRFLFVSRSALKVWRKQHEDILGRSFLESFPQAVGSESYEAHRRVVKTGLAERFETRSPVLRRWIEVDIAPTRQGGLSVAFRDIEARKHAEAALRESEQRFREFSEAASGALWIRKAETLDLEFASPAISTVYGAPADTLMGDVKKWAALIVPEDRDAALVAVQRVREGASITHEFRIQRPSDQTFRWIRNTGFPMRDGKGDVTRIGGIFEDVTDAKVAVEHQGVLLAELQHRVRNIMAIVRSITARTGERAESVAEYGELMAGRLHALTRVQALLTRAPNAQVRIETIARDEVSVQAEHEGQYDLDGPDVSLSPKAAEILTLAVHELAANALKYGALSVPDGRVTVRWDTVEKRGVPWLIFDWSEQGAPPRPQVTNGNAPRRGFGSELIEARIPYELRGQGELVLEAGGARCHLEFPLGPGASVLETGAPQRATVFGGGLDMSGMPDLRGYRVLVIEDEYYIATDIARTLRGAGATVSGPCGSEEAARVELVEQRPDAVVLDINLGSGASFKLAETVKDHGIPFVFVTGYDQRKIPEEFKGIERLEKPAQLRHIVQAIGKLVGLPA